MQATLQNSYYKARNLYNYLISDVQGYNNYFTQTTQTKQPQKQNINIEANRSKVFKKTGDAIISRAHNMILTIEQLLNLLNEELNNCVYNNTSDTNGKLTDNRW